MHSLKSRLFIPFGLAIGLLILAVGVLQWAMPQIVAGLAVVAGLILFRILRLGSGQVWDLGFRIVHAAIRNRSPHNPQSAIHNRSFRNPKRRPEPAEGSTIRNRRSPYGWSYRLVTSLVIAGLLMGMLPPLGPALRPLPRPAQGGLSDGAEGIAYAAPQQRPAAQTQDQAGAGDDIILGRQGQPVVSGPPGVAVNLANGNLHYRRVDLTTSSGGYRFPVLHSELSYSSLLRDEDLGFGYGWRLGYSMTYREENDGDITIRWPAGGEVRFDGRGGVFHPPSGIHDRLTQPSAGTYRLITLEGTTYYFDSPRHRGVTRIEAEDGLALTFTYDQLGQLTTIQDAYSRTLRLDYEGGHVTSITNDFLNQSLTLTYTTGSLTAIAGPAGQVTSYAYEGDLLFQVTLPDDRAYTFDYDQRGRVIAIRGSFGSWDFSYGQNEAYLYRTVKGQARRTKYTFDDNGRVTEIEDPLGNVTQFEWDDQDNLIAMTDPEGYRTTHTYDQDGNLRTVTDPLGRTAVYTYAAGTSRLVAQEDALKRVRRYEYDDRGRLVQTIAPDGGVTTFSYAAVGSNILTITAPLGNTTIAAYDTWGRRVMDQSPSGQQVHLRYDARDRLRDLIISNLVTFTMDYDDHGNLISFGPLSETPYHYTYTVAGLPTDLIYPSGTTWRYGYDDQGFLEEVLNPLGGVTHITWSGEQIASVTNPNGQTSLYSWDANDRAIAYQDPLGHTTSYARDARGLPIRFTQPDGSFITFERNALGQTVTQTATTGRATHYQYDAVGNLTLAATEQVSVTFTYNAMDLHTEVNVFYRPTGQTYTVRYEYNLAGERTAMVDPQGGRTTYTYDADGRLASLTDPDGRVTTFAYDGRGRLVRRTDPNGIILTATYDAWGQPTDVRYEKNGAVLFHETLTYDADGNPIRIEEEGGPSLDATYGPLGQLLTAQTSDGLSWAYTYDPNGNRVSQSGSAGGVTYTYDAADQLLRANNGVTPIDYTYDPRGNLAARTTASGTYTYTWETYNWLAGGTAPNGDQVTYAYYPDGLPLSRTMPDGRTILYIYDQENLLVEVDTGSGGVEARYLSMPGIRDAWLSMQRGEQTYTYLADHLGSIRGLADTSGSLAATYRYAPYGELLSATGIVENSIRYTGRRWDPYVGLYNYRSRYYDPGTGRFISRDTDPGVLTDPRTLNRYMYVANNPLRYTDPTGNGFWDFFGLGEKARCVSEQRRQRFDQIVDSHSQGPGPQDLSSWSTQTDYQATHQFLEELAHEGSSIPGTSLTGPPGVSDIVNWLIPWPGGGPFSGGGRPGGSSCGPPPPSPPSGRPPGRNGSGGGPTGGRPPASPGNDHQDDTLSAASRQLPPAGLTGLISDFGLSNPQSRISNLQSPVYRRIPRVAILWNGFAEEAAAFLNNLGEPFDTLDPDFSPAVAALYEVLLIPSGGLYGLEGSASFRARLETYVAGGGTILASTQQRGYEFSALPGGLGGYGWTEDQSCFSASVLFPQFVQALSSFNQASLNVLVDGYFTTFPENTISLLDRDKTGHPSALLYPYGDGYVMATTIYADWGRSNYQHTRDDVRVWRDLIAWGTLGALPDYNHTLPNFSPGDAVDLPVRVVNAAGRDAAAVRFVLLDPNKGIVEQRVVSDTVSVGQVGNLSYTTTAESPLGVWAVDYVLLDDAGNALQDQAIGAAFIVSDPAEPISPDRPWDFSITAPTEHWVRGTTGEFTFHVRNRTAQDRSNVQVRYVWPHHAWEGGGPSYGYPDRLVYDVGTVAAGEEKTFTVQAQMFTQDRLFGTLYEGGTPQRSTSFQIRSLPAAAQVDVQPAQDSYFVGEPVTVTVVVTNIERAGYTAIARLRALDPARALIDAQDEPVALGGQGSTTLVYTLTMPATPTFGLHTVQVEVVRDDQVVGSDQAHFDLPAPHVAVSVQGPAAYRLGQDNSVAFRLENQSGTPVDAGTFNVRLEAPDGQTIWQTSDAFNLAGFASTTFTHDVPFGTELGVYTFHYDVRMRGGLISRDSHAVPAAYAVTRETDKARYAGGETLAVTVTVQNIGDFGETLDVRLEVPDATFDQAQAVAPDVGQVANLSYQVPLPTDIAGGVHPMTVTLTTGVGSSAAKRFQYIILPANLRLSLPAGAGLQTLAGTSPQNLAGAGLRTAPPYQAGGSLPVVVANIGGGVTDYTGQLSLRDSSGRLIFSGNTAGTVGSGEADTFDLPLPADLKDGLYTLEASYTAQATGQQVGLTRIVAIGGLEADLSAATEKLVYRTGETINASAGVTNTGDFAIADSTLALEGISMLGGDSPLAGVVQDNTGQRLAGARITLDQRESVWTNLAGEYRLENVGVGDHHFQVERVGYQDYAASHFVAGPQEPLTLTLVARPTAALMGTVHASGGMTIVVGADVALGGALEVAQPHRRTGGEGSYQFAGLTPGTYDITVTAPGFQDYTASITLSEGNNTHDVFLQTGLIAATREGVRAVEQRPALRADEGSSGAGEHGSRRGNMTANSVDLSNREPGIRSIPMDSLSYLPAEDLRARVERLGDADRPPILVARASPEALRPVATVASAGSTSLYDVNLTSSPAARLRQSVSEHAGQTEKFIPMSNLQSPVLRPGSVQVSNLRPPGLAAPPPTEMLRPLGTDVSGDIISDTTWTTAGSPYVLTGDVVVTPTVTLTVEPGVVVMGQSGTELKVQGHLAAVGAPAQPITFTSSADSGPDQWSGLVFDGGTGELRHATVRYGGNANSVLGGNYPGSNITVRNVLTGQVRIEDSQVRSVRTYYFANRTDYGLYVANSRVVVSGTTFANNGNDTSDYALYATGASTVITLTDSTFQNNAGWAMRAQANNLHQVTIAGNSFSGNGKNRVLVAGGALATSTTLPAQAGLRGYELGGDLTVPAGVTLTVAPDAAVMGQGFTELKVQGHLAAVGTVTQPITFTSSADSGSDQWSGLVFDGGTGELRHATVRYGGNANSVLGGNYPGSNITVRNVLTGQVRIEDSQVRSVRTYYFANRTDYGLYVADSRVVVSGTTFANNGNDTSDYALYATGASTTITVTSSTFQNNAGRGISVANDARGAAHYSHIYNNGGYQASQSGSTPLDVRLNWWGQSPPSAGLFSGNVVYDPWIITETFAAGHFDLARDTYEPNDTFAQATPASVNTAIAAFLDPLADTDVYRLNVDPGSDLVAIADATGTPLALQVSLYDGNENLLTTATGSAGGVITATTLITPGLYFVRVTGTGSAPISHLPYRLTLLQVDSRSDLVAQTVAGAGGGRTYNFGAFAVNLAPGESTAIAATAPVSLTTPRRLFPARAPRQHPRAGAGPVGHALLPQRQPAGSDLEHRPAGLPPRPDRSRQRPGAQHRRGTQRPTDAHPGPR